VRLDHLHQEWNDSSRAAKSLSNLSEQIVAEDRDNAQELLTQVRSYGEFLLGVRKDFFEAAEGVWLDQRRLLAQAKTLARSQREMNVDLGPLNVVKSDA
jgi:hypothetical protein